jgi:hypothetical protein
MLSFLSRCGQVAVKDVAVQLPSPIFSLPDDDVLAGVQLGAVMAV